MRSWVVLPLLAILLQMQTGVWAATTERIAVGGRVRRTLLHKPPVKNRKVQLPLVIVLHGDNGSAAQIRRLAGFDAIASREGFYVAYPEGSGFGNFPPRGWNAGGCCGYASNAQVDDIGFIATLIDQLIQAYPVDPQRIYAVGLSNGAMMAHRLGCELSHRIAAIAAVAGALTAAVCEPVSPVSVLMVHGTDDAYVPYEGGHGRQQPTDRIDPPAATVAGFWAQRNGCPSSPQVEQTAAVIRQRHAPCRQQTEVVMYALRGEGHRWPEKFDNPEGLSTAELIWEFFARHRREESAVPGATGLLK